jgi:amidophosphoribosyltransferase
VDEICEIIGADGLMYQDLDDLIIASKGVNENIKGFDCAVFNGEYITADVTPEYLVALEQARSDATKHKRTNNIVDVSDENEDEASDDATVGIHNELS